MRQIGFRRVCVLATVIACAGTSLNVHLANAQPSNPTLSSPAARAGGDVRLEPVWKPGQDLRYVLKVEREDRAGPGQLSAAATVKPIKTVQETTLLRRVVETSASETSLLFTIERVKVRIGLGDEAIEIDTDQPKERDADASIGETARVVLNKPISVKLSEFNTPTRIENNQFTIANMPVGQQLAGDDVFRFQLLPLYSIDGAPRSARVGTTWTTTTDQSARHLGAMLTEATAKVTAINGQSADISIDGKASIRTPIGPSAIRSEVTKGIYKGSATWDGAMGVLSAFDVTRELEYTMDRGDTSGFATQVLRISIQRVDAKGAAAPQDPSKPAHP